MFTVEIRINGALISHVYGHNEGETKNGKDKYSFELYQVESRKITNGEVWHARPDGINQLVAGILSASSLKTKRSGSKKKQITKLKQEERKEPKDG